jgi:hypothetical protein
MDKNELQRMLTQLSWVVKIEHKERNIKAHYDGAGCVYRYTNNVQQDAPRRAPESPRIDWQVYLLAGLPTTSLECSGANDSEPEWLKNVLALARVGGHYLQMPSPPPSVVVWFETTNDGVFVKFYEW